ncbi:MAG: serine/threonine protein kinase [Planctomycetota bacterium]|nr:serine/threonine protein kinase [Planctomycetota bacterium]
MTGKTAVDTFIPKLDLLDDKPSMPCGTVVVERLLDVRPSGSNFLAHHVGLDLPVLLRVMHPAVTAKLRDIELMRDWTRRMARVRHRNLATIFDLGVHLDHGYLIMEYVCGVPLCERIKERPYAPDEALRLLAPIADGLAAYWEQDVVHRGVSPHRVYIACDGRSILDLVILPKFSSDVFLRDLHEPWMAGFWAPEEVRRSEEIDPRTDMFSFGATMYYALTGATPFGELFEEKLLKRTLETRPPEPRQRIEGLSEELNAFLKTCLQPDPDHRYETPRKFLEALAAAQASQTCRETQLAKSGGNPAPSGEKGTSFGVGDVIGRCRLEQKLGSGAFGVVYRARHLVLDIEVAVKMLPLNLARESPQYVEMFLREARTAARLRHPNVIGIFEAGEANGQHYLVMEYAPGGTLYEFMNLRGGKLSVEEALPILRDAARGLAAAEELRIIHRDIKPDNLMFGADGTLKIADLGLAKRLPSQDSSASILASLQKEQLTQKAGEATQVVGTPAYMAPELALRPQEADTRADQYALGCTAYQMLSGEFPLLGENSFVTIMRHIHDAPAPLNKKAPGIPAALNDLVMKMLEKDPEQRFPSAKELVKALEQLEAAAV